MSYFCHKTSKYVIQCMTGWLADTAGLVFILRIHSDMRMHRLAPKIKEAVNKTEETTTMIQVSLCQATWKGWNAVSLVATSWSILPSYPKGRSSVLSRKLKTDGRKLVTTKIPHVLCVSRSWRMMIFSVTSLCSRMENRWDDKKKPMKHKVTKRSEDWDNSLKIQTLFAT